MAWTPSFTTSSKFVSDRSANKRQFVPKTERFTINLNKSYTASQIFDESHGDNLDVRSLSHGLPVIVSDGLSANKEFTGSARFSSHDDFTWLVVGRKLFVWKYSSPGKVNTCRELTLPVSDLEHKACLVSMSGLRSGSESASHNSPGCIVVSPEGMVRYWPRIYQEDVYLEATSILRGEECVQLEEVRDGIYLLATTTCTLLRIDIRNANTLGIVCSVLGKPSGLWSGLGRRVSSFFTLSSGQTAYNLKCVRVNHMDENNVELFILTEQELQCKLFTSNLEETTSYEVNVVRMVREEVSLLLWRQESYTLPNLKIQPIDMDIHGTDVFILLAVTNTDVSVQANTTVHYVLAQYRTSGEEFEKLVRLQWTDSLRPGEKLSSFRLVLPGDAHLYPCLTACVWDPHCVRVVEVPTGNILSAMSFSAHGDGVLCCSATSVHLGQFLIFSRKYRILSIRTKRSGADTSNVSMLSHNNSAVGSTSPIHSTPFVAPSGPRESMPPEDIDVGDLTNASQFVIKAFQNYSNGYKGHTAQLLRLLEKRLESRRNTSAGDFPDNKQWRLDEAVVALSNAICDEAPAADPRWEQPMRTSLAWSESRLVPSASVIILNHLEDKRRVHQSLLPFLNEFGLTGRLSSVNLEERTFSTLSVINVNSERLEAAIILRSLHNSYGDVISSLISNTMQHRLGVSQSQELTPSDLFYREVTRIDDIFNTVLESLNSHHDPQEKTTAEQTIKFCHILVTILREVSAQRRSHSRQHGDSSNVSAFTTNLIAVNQGSLVAIVDRLITVAGQASAESGPSRLQLASHLVDLVDLLLSGMSLQLEHAKEQYPTEALTVSLKSEFERTRTTLINALYKKLSETDSALQLAEKYHEFDLIVRICEESGARERLQRYMRQFANQGFQEFVYRWYLREGKRGQLMSAQFGHHQKLAQFLESEDNQYMAWLQHVNSSDFDKAADNLKELAFLETNSLRKKKTLLSLAKLGCLAAADTEDQREDDIEKLNGILDIVKMQESLPKEVLHNLGMDKENQPVFSPENLIDICISEHNPQRDVSDFRRALDLVHWLPEEKQTEVKLHIWCQALLVDDWSQAQVKEEDPMTAFRDTLFYRILESAFMEDIDIQEYLPALPALLNADELTDLTEDKHFVFLLRAGYEQLSKMC